MPSRGLARSTHIFGDYIIQTLNSLLIKSIMKAHWPFLFSRIKQLIQWQFLHRFFARRNCCKKIYTYITLDLEKDQPDFDIYQEIPQIRRKLVAKPKMELGSFDSQVSAHVSLSKRICSEVILSNYLCYWIQDGLSKYLKPVYEKIAFPWT